MVGGAWTPVQETYAARMTGIGLADLGDRLAGVEVLDLVDFKRFVRFAPTEHGNVEHGSARQCWSPWS